MACHTRCERQRHVEVFDAEGAQRIEYGIDDGGRRTDAAGFARALHAERISSGRDFDRFGREIRNARRARKLVVHQRPRQELSLAVEHHRLAERLPDALRKPAVDLAVKPDAVENLSAIVDCDETDNLRRPGLRIDLDLADIAAVRIVGGRGVEGCGCAQAQFGRSIGGRATIGGGRDGLQRGGCGPFRRSTAARARR